MAGEPNLFLKGKEMKSGGRIFRVAGGGGLKMVLTTNQWLLVGVSLAKGIDIWWFQNQWVGWDNMGKPISVIKGAVVFCNCCCPQVMETVGPLPRSQFAPVHDVVPRHV